MAPTADLVKSPSTLSAINSTTNNNQLSFPADISGPNPSSAGIFRRPPPPRLSIRTGVCTNNTSISTLVPVPISVSSYCKALISKLFFRQILDYADSPSIFIVDLKNYFFWCFNICLTSLYRVESYHIAYYRAEWHYRIEYYRAGR